MYIPLLSCAHFASLLRCHSNMFWYFSRKCSQKIVLDSLPASLTTPHVAKIKKRFPSVLIYFQVQLFSPAPQCKREIDNNYKERHCRPSKRGTAFSRYIIHIQATISGDLHDETYCHEPLFGFKNKLYVINMRVSSKHGEQRSYSLVFLHPLPK